jgi:hypothetical protein
MVSTPSIGEALGTETGIGSTERNLQPALPEHLLDIVTIGSCLHKSGAQLSNDDVRAVAAYVCALSHQAAC